MNLIGDVFVVSWVSLRCWCLCFGALFAILLLKHFSENFDEITRLGQKAFRLIQFILEDCNSFVQLLVFNERFFQSVASLFSQNFPVSFADGISCEIVDSDRLTGCWASLRGRGLRRNFTFRLGVLGVTKRQYKT